MIVALPGLFSFFFNTAGIMLLMAAIKRLPILISFSPHLLHTKKI